jgi:hypothetical protein
MSILLLTLLSPASAGDFDSGLLAAQPTLENSQHLVVQLRVPKDPNCGTTRFEWQDADTDAPDTARVSLSYVGNPDCKLEVRTQNYSLGAYLDNTASILTGTAPTCFKKVQLMVNYETFPLDVEGCLRDDGPALVPGVTERTGGTRGKE